MTRALVLYAHPVEGSFCAALHAIVLDRLAAKGWDVDDCDLNAEGFDPVMGADERRAYHDTARNTHPVAPEVARLRAADALFLVHPVWNFGFPAILKGFIDRVFLPGVSFRLEDGRVKPALANIRTLVTVTTYGADRLRAFWAGDPPRRFATRVLRHIVAPGARCRYLALYDMNRADDARRRAFLDRVRRELDALP